MTRSCPECGRAPCHRHVVCGACHGHGVVRVYGPRRLDDHDECGACKGRGVRDVRTEEAPW